MLVPQFTLRWILAATAVCAVLSLVVRWAVNGSPWAYWLAAAIVVTAVIFLFHAATFGLVWVASEVAARRDPAAGGKKSGPDANHQFGATGAAAEGRET